MTDELEQPLESPPGHPTPESPADADDQVALESGTGDPPEGPLEPPSPDVDAIHAAIERDTAAAETAEPEPEAGAAPGASGSDGSAAAKLAELISELVAAGEVRVDELLTMFGELVEQVQPFKQSSVMLKCDECDGWGSVLTGAKLPGPGVQPCPACNGNGYVDTRTPGYTPPPEGGPVEPPPTFTPAGPDPMRRPPAQGGTPPAIGMEWDSAAGEWRYPAAV